MRTPLTGRVVALVGTGTTLDRAIAVALAEAGADVSIATQKPVQEQEFATASIANEVWAIGQEQFSYVMDASQPGAVARFVAETRARLGTCDAVVITCADAAIDGVGRVLVITVDGSAGVDSATDARERDGIAAAGVLEELARKLS